MIYCCLSSERADKRSVRDGIHCTTLFCFLGHRWSNSDLLPLQNGVYWDAFGKSCILYDGFQMYIELPVIIYYSRSNGCFHRYEIMSYFS